MIEVGTRVRVIKKDRPYSGLEGVVIRNDFLFWPYEVEFDEGYWFSAGFGKSQAFKKRFIFSEVDLEVIT